MIENWLEKIQLVGFAVLFFVGIYFLICTILYEKWTGRNFMLDRFFRRDRPNETISLLLLAYKEYQEKQKYQIKTSNNKNTTPTGVFFGVDGKGKWYTSKETEEGNIACFGFQGTGKTTGIMIPTLLNWHGRVFCIDISGDISASVKRPRQYSYKPDQGIGVYDVFYDVKRAKNKEDRLELLARIAQLLIPEKNHTSDNSKYFTDNGRKMLNAALIYYYARGYEFGEMCLEIVKQSAIELLRTIAADERMIEDILPLISSFSGANEKNTQGCKETVDQTLNLFATNAKVRKTLKQIEPTSKKGIAPYLLESIDMFICIPQEKLGVYQPLLRLIVGQMFNYYVGRSLKAKTVILFALDEFGRFGQIDGIVDALGTLRKRKVRVMLLTQNVSDIDAVYGQHTRDAILGNCTFSVCLGAKDIVTQRYFSELTGEHYKTRYGVNTGERESRYTITEERTAIIEPASLAYLSKNKQVLLLAPQGYKFLRKKLWFEDAKLKAKAEKLRANYFEQMKKRKRITQNGQQQNKNGQRNGKTKQK